MVEYLLKQYEGRRNVHGMCFHVVFINRRRYSAPINATHAAYCGASFDVLHTSI